jgi:hypothetical protein
MGLSIGITTPSLKPAFMKQFNIVYVVTFLQALLDILIVSSKFLENDSLLSILSTNFLIIYFL